MFSRIQQINHPKMVKVVTNRYMVLAFFLFAYTSAMSFFGGMPPLNPLCRLEIPLLLGCYYILNQATRPSKWQPLIAAIPLLFAYIIFDIVFLQFGRMFRLAELKELPELLAVLPVWLIGGFGLLGGAALFIFFRSLTFTFNRSTIIGILSIVGMVLVMEFLPDSFVLAFEKVQRPVTNWSDIKSVEDNGRIWMMLYNEAKRKSNTMKLANFQEDQGFLKKIADTVSMVGSLERKRNVHLLVLESFVDPTLFDGATYSRPPAHPDFEKIFAGKGSLSLAPLFGGGTAQSEFEVLAGVPAFAKFSGMEFDVFNGTRTYCLPALLNQAGYTTMSTNAFKPDFFNSINAYKGVGFQESYYPKEYAPGRETYLSTGDLGDEMYMFDGELLQQNLAAVTRKIKEHPGEPLFNYIMTIYGHYPYLVNTDKRPLIIETSAIIKDGFLEHSVNQFYYRTQALAEYVEGINRIDPDSLIILISDHLPGLYGPNTYEKLRYAGGIESQLFLNRVFFFENGKAVHYNTIHHYDVPDIILNYLSDGQYCKTRVCEFQTGETKKEKAEYDAAYMSVLARAMR